jgi:putative ABC transport system permease protein
MPVLVRIALRNMREHIAKSVIIGVLVALGVIVLVLGNAMMDAAAEGTRVAFIDNFTGDVMVHGPSKAAVSIFGVQSMSMDSDTTVPTIPEFERTLELVRQDPRTEKASGMAVAYALLSVDADETITDAAMESDENGPPFAIVFGVDPENYYDMFPSLKIVEGARPLPGEPAIVIQKSQLESLSKRYKRTFAVGDKILLSGFGTAGFKIREVVIAGVYERVSEQSGPMQMVYADIDTARVLGGLTLGADETVELDAAQTSLLDTDDLDALFGDDMVESVADSD